ncbi:oligosaccharide flippase family protein [Mongoliitalea daihaiensis]|uniref:oligosaccharide flippase family protein n=1 Tax=Mongoliitalea daihaiensis TaxID=2782006 RepID=UPI001F1782F8|nr:oligosaccharide flippase family protein [Mongoliitalea daihaiensis]
MEKKENHKQRAYLNSVTSILDQVVRQLIGFFTSPLIFNGLGSALYGVYQIVLDLSGYAGLADAQSTQVLKWTLAKNRDTVSVEDLKSEITTGLLMVFLIAPFILLVGGVISWFSPSIISIDEKYHDLVRLASAIVIFSIIVDKLSNFFESILRGLNLGFKGMGYRSILIIFGGGLKVFVVKMDFGLIGLVSAQVFLGFLTTFVFYYLVKKNLPWFGLGKTSKEKILSYTKLSGWFIATKFAGMALFHSEKILLGYLIGPEIVSIYVLTMFTSTTMKSFLDSVISGIIPGIGTFFGKGQFDKIILSKDLIFNLIWFISFSIGITVLLFNNSFLSLWVGPGNYAGSFENLLILLIAIQYVLFFTTGNFINVTLDLKTKVYLTGMSALISISLAFLLVPNYQILGLGISVLFGRSVMSVGFPIILNKKLGLKSISFNFQDFRIVVISIIGLTAAAYLQDFIIVESWVLLIAFTGSSFVFSSMLFWLICFNSNQRNQLILRFKSIKFFKVKD